MSAPPPASAAPAAAPAPASPFVKNKKLANFFDGSASATKRAKCLVAFVEGATVADSCTFFSLHYSQIYNTLLDVTQHYDVQFQRKGGKTVSTADLTPLFGIVKRLLLYIPERIHQRWQMRSLCSLVAQMVHPSTKHPVRLVGMENVCLLIEDLEIKHDCNSDLLLAALGFEPFIADFANTERIQLPTVSKGDPFSFAQSPHAPTRDEVVELLQVLLTFVGRSNKFAFWLSILKQIVLPPLYPKICGRLGLADDSGFRDYCPYPLQACVVQHVSQWLRIPDRAAVLCESTETIELLAEIFHQAVRCPVAQYSRTVREAIEGYQRWLVGKTVPAMQENMNDYCKRFVSDVAAPFSPQKDCTIDLHAPVLRDALALFRRIMQKRTSDLTEETLHHVLRTAAQCMENLFSSVMATMEPGLATEVAEATVKSLLVMWVSSGTEANDVWGLLAETLRRCVLWPQVVLAWKELMRRLTEALVARLYNVRVSADEQSGPLVPQHMPWPPSSGPAGANASLAPTGNTPAGSGSQSGEASPSASPRRFSFRRGDDSSARPSTPTVLTDVLRTLSFSSDQWTPAHAFFVWDRCLHLLGNINKIAVPELQCLAVSCLDDMVEVLCSIPAQSGAEPPAASASATASSSADASAPSTLSTPPSTVSIPHLSPTPTTLLALFGFWLTEACSLDSAFLLGKAIAYGTLCRIMCLRSPVPLPIESLPTFYRLLHSGLTGADLVVKEQILEHASHLPGLFLPGANVLIPVFVDSAVELLSQPGVEEPTRLHCIRLLNSLIFLPTHFRSLTVYDARHLDAWIPSTSASSADIVASGSDALPERAEHMISFESLRDRLSTALREAALKQTSAQCLCSCLWGMCVLLMNELTGDLPPRSDCVSLYLRDFIAMLQHADDSVAMTAADILSALAPFEASFASTTMTKIAEFVIKHSCTILMTDFQAAKTRKRSREAVSAQILLAMRDWLTVRPEMLQHTGIAMALFGVIEVALQVEPAKLDDQRRRTASNIRQKLMCSLPIGPVAEAAETLFFTAVHFAESSPSPIGWDVTGSLVNEMDDVPEANAQPGDVPWRTDLVRFFSLNDECIVSCVEVPDPRDPTGTIARVVVRDPTGRYVWDARPTMLEGFSTSGTGTTAARAASPVPDGASAVASSRGRNGSSAPSQASLPSPDDAEPGESTPVSPAPPSSARADTMGFSPYNADASNADNRMAFRRMLDSVFAAHPELVPVSGVQLTPFVNADLPVPEEFSDWMQTIEHYQVQSQSRHAGAEAIAPPEAREDRATPFLKSRLLLQHLGFLSTENRPYFSLLEPSERFWLNLKEVDRTASRETMKIGVIYVARGQEDQRTILKNNCGSQLYEQFVDGLGATVDLHTHRGFLGGLDRLDSAGRDSPYFASPSTEVMFHVVTRMPTRREDPQQVHKKRHVGNDFVHIVWSEHFGEYRPETIKSQFNDAHVVITPHSSGLFTIRVHRKDLTHTGAPIGPFGPLQDGMIVNAQLLVPLVRLTAMNANRAVRSAQGAFKLPFAHRRDRIADTIAKCKMAETQAIDVLEALFGDTEVLRAAAQSGRTGASASISTPTKPLAADAAPDASPAARPADADASDAAEAPAPAGDTQ